MSTTQPAPRPLALPLPASSTLMIVDVQERLLPAMPVDEQPVIVRQIETLTMLMAELGGAALWTEQYPRGLGPTVAPVAAALEAAREIMGSARMGRLDKVEFSVMQSQGIAAHAALVRDDVVLTGMEAHVCVLQTGLDLLARGHRVWVPFDAVGSRKPSYKANGLALLERAGAVIINTESLLFAALGKAGTDVFRRFSARIR